MEKVCGEYIFIPDKLKFLGLIYTMGTPVKFVQCDELALLTFQVSRL